MNFMILVVVIKCIKDLIIYFYLTQYANVSDIKIDTFTVPSCSFLVLKGHSSHSVFCRLFLVYISRQAPQDPFSFILIQSWHITCKGNIEPSLQGKAVCYITLAYACSSTPYSVPLEYIISFMF